MSMRKLAVLTVLLVVGIAVNASAQTRWLSRYWDGCKATCSWTNNVPQGATLAKVCDRTGTNVHSNPNAVRCAKDDGYGANSGYTCWDQIPFVSSSDPNLAYGFGATGGVACGQCFEVTFDGGFRHGTPYATHAALRGKKVIIMARNTGSDVAADQIDFMIPGGGLGLFDCFTAQLGIPRASLGETYGGLLADCERELNWGAGSLSAYQTCLRSKCNQVFSASGHAVLRQGCNFYADFMMAANNPTGTVRNVPCPEELTSRYGGTTYNPPGGGGGPLPVTTYTLNVSRNPTNGGDVRVNNGSNNPSQSTHNAGTSITVSAHPASGFRFASWSAVTGTLPSGFGQTATVTFTINSNMNIRANFEAVTATHTVQVSRSPTAGGSVRVNTTNNPTGQTPFSAGVQVTIAATAAQGYEFLNWTAVTGSLPTGFNANNPSNTFTINSNVNVQANFRLTTTQVTTFTVQASRNPAIGGNVTINGAPAPTQGSLPIEQGTPVTFVATPNTGYTFVNWTAVGGGSLPAGFNATSATNTIASLSSNVNIRANFEQQTVIIDPPDVPLNCTPPGNPWGTCLTLTRTVVPDGAGVIMLVDPANATSFNAQQRVTVRAVANPGFEFANWMRDDISGNINAEIEITIWDSRTIEAHFREATGGGIIVGPPGGGDDYVIPATRTDTLKVEAEDFSERIAEGILGSGNEQMRITTNPALDDGAGITSIGWINAGNVAIYEVGIPNPGDYSLVFRIASNFDGGNSSFRVIVNDVNIGLINGHTGDWDDYIYVTLPTDVELLAGSNTIRLEFQNAVNVDYFLILGEAGQILSSRDNATASVRRAVRPQHTVVRPIPGGFVASLPSNHRYTQYKLIDLQGRVVRSGNIGAGAAEMRMGNLRRGVLFLRLEGDGVAPAVTKAVIR